MIAKDYIAKFWRMGIAVPGIIGMSFNEIALRIVSRLYDWITDFTFISYDALCITRLPYLIIFVSFFSNCEKSKSCELGYSTNQDTSKPAERTSRKWIRGPFYTRRQHQCRVNAIIQKSMESVQNGLQTIDFNESFVAGIITRLTVF